MNQARLHPVEFAAEWGAPLLVAIAVGWAVSSAALPLAAVAAAATIALTIGVVAMRLASGTPIVAEAGFEPIDFDSCAADDVLLLDDPLVENAPDSRVVKLFARQEPTPGELVLRISDYLNDGHRVRAPEAATEHRAVDASAALHSALANIRASLR